MTLTLEDHRTLAAWAADCAEHMPAHAERAAVNAGTALTLAADPDEAAAATNRERD